MSSSEVRLERAMSLSVIEGSLAMVMSTLLGGIFLTGFALELGASRLQIGIMAAIPTLSQAAQFLGVPFLNRTGRSKQMCMIATWMGRLMWFPILIVPACLSDWSGEAQAWCVIALLAIASCSGSIGGLAWLDWIKRLIPEERRVAFMARRNLYNSGLSLAMTLIAAVVIACWHTSTTGSAEATNTTGSTGGFLTVFAIAMVCGIIGVWLLGKIPSADCAEPLGAVKPSVMLEPIKSSNFRSLLMGYAVWQFATQMAAPFYAVYMLQKLAVPFWAVTALTTAGSLLALSLNGAWARLKIRFGVRPVVLLATLGDVFLPIAWLFIHPQTYWLILPVHLFAMFNPPLVMGPQNMLLKIAPNRNTASYMALFNLANGGIGALGAIFGGWLAMALQGHWNAGGFELTGIQLLFLLAGVGKLMGFILLSQVHEAGAHSLKDVARALPNNRVRNYFWQTSTQASE